MEFPGGLNEVALNLVHLHDFLFHSSQWLQAVSCFRNCPGLMHTWSCWAHTTENMHSPTDSMQTEVHALNRTTAAPPKACRYPYSLLADSRNRWWVRELIEKCVVIQQGIAVLRSMNLNLRHARVIGSIPATVRNAKTTIATGSNTTSGDPHLRRVVAFCVCRYWVVTRLVTRRVRAHFCVRETCVRRLRVTVYGIILPFARGCRVGV